MEVSECKHLRDFRLGSHALTLHYDCPKKCGSGQPCRVRFGVCIATYEKHFNGHLKYELSIGSSVKSGQWNSISDNEEMFVEHTGICSGKIMLKLGCLGGTAAVWLTDSPRGIPAFLGSKAVGRSTFSFSCSEGKDAAKSEMIRRALNIGGLVHTLNVHGGVRRYLELGNAFVSGGNNYHLFAQTLQEKKPWLNFKGNQRPYHEYGAQKLDILITGAHESFRDLMLADADERVVLVVAKFYADRYLKLWRERKQQLKWIGVASDWNKGMEEIVGTCIPGGVNTKFFTPVFPAQERKPVVAFYARTGDGRGVERIIGLAKILWNDATFIGFDAPGYPTISDNLPSNVRIVHTPTQEALRDVLQSADVVVSCMCSAGWNNVISEGCLASHTMIIEKSKGIVPIQSLCGKKVKVWDGDNWSNASVVYSGKKRKVEIEFWGGTRIVCSENHKFLTQNTNSSRFWKIPSQFWKKNEKVLITDIVPEYNSSYRLEEVEKIHPIKNFQGNYRMITFDSIIDDFECGFCLGRLASDGSIHRGNLVWMCSSVEEYAVHALSGILSVFPNMRVRRIDRDKEGRKPMIYVCVTSHALAEQTRRMNLKNRIPEYVWSNRERLRGFIRGMFDGDGGASSSCIRLTFGQGTKFVEYARDIQLALLVFGIRSRICSTAKETDVNILRKDNVLFVERIGFADSSKNKKALALPIPKRDGERIQGRSIKVKNVVVTDEFIDMYDVVNSESGRFIANGLVVHNSACGCVPIANDAGTKDVILHERTGFMCGSQWFEKEAAEYIKHLAANRNVLDRMSRRAHSWVQQFDWDIVAEKIISEVYR